MKMAEKTVSVSELKARLSECLRRVKEGERWTVTPGRSRGAKRQMMIFWDGAGAGRLSEATRKEGFALIDPAESVSHE